MARHITLKGSVRPPSFVILSAAANTASEMGISLYVTSGNDSRHMKGSRHYTNEAIDFRSKTMTKAQKGEFIALMQKRLGKSYQVFLESEGAGNEHIHAEYDPD